MKIDRSGQLLAEPRTEITLYVAGSVRSADMIERITGEAEGLGDRVELSIVDVLEDPARAERDTILTTPMMVRWVPSPVRRLTGDIGGLSQLLPSAAEMTSPAPRVSPAVDSDRDAGAVIGRAAHELRTPLTVIQGYAATLLESIAVLDERTALKCAEAIVRGGTQLQSVVDSMLVAREVERGGVRLDLVEVNLGHLVQETIRDLEMLTTHHSVVVDVTEDVTVQGDAVKVRQIITNLVSNAVKFSPNGSTVTVTLRLTAEGACLKVQDEGSGIALDKLESVFEQYERLGRPEKGLGLGLYISRQLAIAHGGRLSALSDGETGTRLELFLPRT